MSSPNPIYLPTTTRCLQLSSAEPGNEALKEFQNRNELGEKGQVGIRMDTSHCLHSFGGPWPGSGGRQWREGVQGDR